MDSSKYKKYVGNANILITKSLVIFILKLT